MVDGYLCLAWVVEQPGNHSAWSNREICIAEHHSLSATKNNGDATWCWLIACCVLQLSCPKEMTRFRHAFQQWCMEQTHQQPSLDVFPSWCTVPCSLRALWDRPSTVDPKGGGLIFIDLNFVKLSQHCLVDCKHGTCTTLKATGLLSCLYMKIISFRMKLKWM